MKKNQLIQYNIKIKTCTPLHIGNGFGVIEKYQYIYEPKKNILSFIDEHKWIDLITRKRLWSRYREYVKSANQNGLQFQQTKGYNNQHGKQRQSIPPLFEWLRECRITEQDIASVIRSKANVYTEKLNQESLNAIHPIIAQADGRLYIPGSSIKGFVRSAILHHLITTNKNEYRQEWEGLKESIKSYRYRVKNVINSIENKAFITLQTIQDNTRKSGKKVQGMMTASVMRGILISDAIATKPRSETPTIIVQKIDVSPDSFNERPMPLFRECIAPNTEFTATITLDTAMTSTIGINNLADLEKILFEYLRFAYAKQKEVFGSKYRKTFQAIDSANLSLGGGTGFHVKTLIRTLAPDEEEARKVTVDWMKLAFRQNKHEVDRKISPRKLKITRMEAQAEFMGLCTLTEE